MNSNCYRSKKLLDINLNTGKIIKLINIFVSYNQNKCDHAHIKCSQNKLLWKEYKQRQINSIYEMFIKWQIQSHSFVVNAQIFV